MASSEQKVDARIRMVVTGVAAATCYVGIVAVLMYPAVDAATLLA